MVLEVSKLKAHTAIVPNSPGQHLVPHLEGSSPIDGFESANVHIAFRILGMWRMLNKKSWARHKSN